MFTAVMCPTCQHKFRVPEGSMGKRHNCPNCQTPFLAGRSEAEPNDAVEPQPAAVPALNKTMLAEPEPPIRSTCPRCKKSVESPASEAGTKKPCPHCGQRLLIPAPPPPAAAQPGLNKTLLALDETKAAPPPAKEAKEVPAVVLLPESRAKAERCLECGRSVTGWERVFTCQDCGSVFCSSLCIREHRANAHDRREREPRRRPEPDREPLPAPEADYTALIVVLVVGGILLVFLLLWLLLFLIYWR